MNDMRKIMEQLNAINVKEDEHFGSKYQLRSATNRYQSLYNDLEDLVRETRAAIYAADNTKISTEGLLDDLDFLLLNHVTTKADRI